MRLLSLVTVLACLGCDGDAGDDKVQTPTDSGDVTQACDETRVVPAPTEDAGAVELDGECAPERRFGGFTVAHTPLYSVADGAVADGIVPATVLEFVSSEGECQLLKGFNPFCDPPCTLEETCNLKSECVPYPAGQDLGCVTVGGLEKDAVMSPVQPGNTYFDTELPLPVFQPGQVIELRTEGGAYGPVVLHGVGVDDIAVNEKTWILFEDQELPFTWNPPTTSPVRSHVHVRLDIDQHGVTPIRMFCEFEDDGAAALPAALITQLINSGVTGFPNVTVTRRTVDSADVGAGCMDFTVKHAVTPDVRVDGFTPCFSDIDCPKGQTCNLAIQICE